MGTRPILPSAGGVDNRLYVWFPFKPEVVKMRIFKLLDKVSISVGLLFSGAANAEIKGINPKSGEKIHIFVEVSDCKTTQMVSDTIDAAVEDHLGIAYSYTKDDKLKHILEREMKELLDSKFGFGHIVPMKLELIKLNDPSLHLIGTQSKLLPQ